MTTQEILKDFSSAVGHFPRAALEAAVAQREEITPELLRIVEVAAQDPSVAGKGSDELNLPSCNYATSTPY